MRNATSCRSSSSSSSWTRIDSSTAAPNSDVALLTGGLEVGKLIGAEASMGTRVWTRRRGEAAATITG